MKLKDRTKAKLIIYWLALSGLAVMCTAPTLDSEYYGIPLIISLISLILASIVAIRHEDIIDRTIKMID